MYGIAKGQNWLRSGNFGNNTAWTSNGYTQANTPFVFYNYKSNVQDLALEGLFFIEQHSLP